jgi:uncharacterized Zn finger protein
MIMNSRVQKVKIELVCARCSKRIQWAWVIKYKSFRLTRYVYVCGECGNVIKVTNACQGDNRHRAFGSLHFLGLS